MKALVLLSLLTLAGSGAMNAQGVPMKIALDGVWLFRPDTARTGIDEGWFSPAHDRTGWREVEIPGFWESYPGLAGYDGWGWFARTVTISADMRPASVHFAGVDDDATVWVNGLEIGGHTGYSEPFALDLGSALVPGDNLIVVQVRDHAGGGGIYRPVTLIETARLDELLKGPLFGTPALRSADWVKDAVIYEVYLRSFSPEGTFAGLERRLPELKRLGVTILWLMPIHPVGVKHRKGTLGSPYAVQDYYGINPEFGTMRDFKRLLGAVHRQGMKLIIDLVANHTSWDSRLMHEHPEWFTRDAGGDIVAPNADWTDVADLDYSQAGLRDAMIEMMRWWVKDVGIDGFRCDVSELVPTDFWEEARRRLNRIKPVVMLSEGSLPEHHVRAFDLTYSWNVYDVLEPLLTAGRPVSVIDEILKVEALQFPVGALRMRFNTNHDKNAWDAPAVTKFGPDGLALSAVLVHTLPGVPMIYNGEEVANDRKLGLFEKVPIDWSRPAAMRTLYTALTALRRGHKALTRGSMLRIPGTFPDEIYAFFRVAGTDRVLVVLNFGGEERTAALQVPMDQLFPRAKAASMKEYFTGSSLRLEPGVPAELTVPARGYRVFVLP